MQKTPMVSHFIRGTNNNMRELNLHVQNMHNIAISIVYVGIILEYNPACV